MLPSTTIGTLFATEYNKNWLSMQHCSRSGEYKSHVGLRETLWFRFYVTHSQLPLDIQTFINRVDFLNR